MSYIFSNKLIILLVFISLLLIYSYLQERYRRNELITYEENYPEDCENAEFNINTAITNKQYLHEIKRVVKIYNKEQIVRNVHQHFTTELLLGKNTIVIVIEVRTNTFYLESLIESLKHVTGITNSLLVFSHEYFDEDINVIIRNISFTKYIQIFYPYSVQLHPNKFPGCDGKFCIDELYCVEDDSRRNASEIQLKHHWLWRMSFVFDHLKVTKYFEGKVIFLVEDQQIAEDAIYIVRLMEKVLSNNYPQCEIMVLGASSPNITQYHVVETTMTVGVLGSTQELMGMVFNRSVWSAIKSLSHDFCSFNDANWVRSLIYATSKSDDTFQLCYIEGPRVFRFGRCPYEDSECGDLDKVEAVQSFIKKIRRGLFPRKVSIKVDRRFSNISKGQGGWDDARDRGLCRYFTRTR